MGHQVGCGATERLRWNALPGGGDMDLALNNELGLQGKKIWVSQWCAGASSEELILKFSAILQAG